MGQIFHPHARDKAVNYIKSHSMDTDTDRMKKALRETQTLRAGCSKAEPKISAPSQTPFQGAQDGQNLISWR